MRYRKLLFFVVIKMICILEIAATLALRLVGFSILIGVLKPEDALKRAGAFLVVVIIIPIILATIAQKLLVPAFQSFWSAARPALTLVGAFVVVAVIVWIVISIMQHAHE